MKNKLINLILLIFFLNINILAAEKDDRLSLLPPDGNLSIYSETILVNAIENIKQNKIEKALEQLSKLIKINPDFKAAQLMYADLMLSRSQQITDFGNIQNASFTHINSLLSEVKARWEFHKDVIDKDKFPSLDKLIQKDNFEGYKLKYNINGSFYYMGKESILPEKCIQKIYPYSVYEEDSFSVYTTKPIIILDGELFIQA